MTLDSKLKNLKVNRILKCQLISYILLSVLLFLLFSSTITYQVDRHCAGKTTCGGIWNAWRIFSGHHCLDLGNKYKIINVSSISQKNGNILLNYFIKKIKNKPYNSEGNNYIQYYKNQIHHKIVDTILLYARKCSYCI